ncbi:MAG: DUF1045 domain-containing protein, partial [Pseudomonadota bacterium]
PEGAFFDLASAWLGWDSVAGERIMQPEVPGLPDTVEALTSTPRKYGFHGTVKPPFALAEGHSFAELDQATRAFCAGHEPVVIPKLQLRRVGGFVAVTPSEPSAALADFAAATVAALDAFRAPPSPVELSLRRQAGLSPRQETLLSKWGYPYVMEEFRFHLTLTGRTGQADAVCAALEDHFVPALPRPFVIDSLAVMGEDFDGMFHLIERYALSG